MSVDMLVAAVGVIGSVVVALVARMTGFTQDDRSRARIVRDAALWKALPHDSAARPSLAAHIDEATGALLAEREKDHRFERLLAVGAWFAFGTWVLLLAFSALPYDPTEPGGEPFWMDQVRQALFISTVVAATSALAFTFLGLWVGAPRAWAWLTAKFGR